MDPRLEHRRRRVAEDRARSNLSRLLRILVVLAFIAGLVWLAQSPLLSVSRIEVSGAEQVDVESVLAAHDVAEGRPMLLLDIGGAARTLREDPWVAEADVARQWPTSVVVVVTERVPAASVQLREGWWLAASDGTLLTEADMPDSDMGRALFGDMTATEAIDDLDVAGAVAFLAALPPERQPTTVVTRGQEGLEAVVDGFTVRLGRPFDMVAKADVTVAIIDDGLEEGSIITVMAPASPAVLPPGGGVPTDDPDNPDDPDTSTPTTVP